MTHGGAQVGGLEGRGIAVGAGDAELVGNVGGGTRLGGRLQHAGWLLQQGFFLSLQGQLRQHHLQYSESQNRIVQCQKCFNTKASTSVMKVFSGLQ